eukprot:TRINITY_DN9520_c0_g1_i1.p1 TRINITY_DN9520_c0_g1~~TRINITY_DN9520_c0_g1_i1.p1  ORF type:complete len:384 (+),score=76.64 TRINITY_DN9520_c0_g1_i1:844-1995(+)
MSGIVQLAGDDAIMAGRPCPLGGAARTMACIGVLAALLTTVGAAPVTRVATRPLGRGLVGRIDHIDWDVRGRIAVNVLGANATVVVEAGAEGVLGTLRHEAAPQGVAFTADGKGLLVTDAGDGVVRLYNASAMPPGFSTLPVVAAVDLGVDADDVLVATDAGTLWVGYGDSDSARRREDLPPAGLAEIDGTTGRVRSVTALPAHAEGFALSRRDAVAWVNTPDANGVVVVVNRTSQAVLATWALEDPEAHKPLRENFPMRLVGDGLIAVGYRAPPRIVLVNTSTGRVVASAVTAGDLDDIWYDASCALLLATGGSGAIEVYRVATGPSVALTRVAAVPTAAMARTSFYNGATRQLLVAVPQMEAGDGDPALWVYNVTGRCDVM